MSQVVLLGDSIFDNAAYVSGGPDVVAQLGELLPAGWRDALGHADLLDRPARSSAQVLGWLADAAEGFEARYRRMLAQVRARGLPVTLCTVYNGNLGPPAQRLATTALAVFNDAVLRLADRGAVSS